MADGPFDFGQVFVNALAQGRQMRQSQEAQQSLQSFRRDSLNEQARQAKKGEEIQGMLVDLRREAETREKSRDATMADYYSRSAGTQEKAAETDAARETRLAADASRTIPVPAFLREELGVDALPASAYGAGVTSAGQAYVMRQQAQLSRELRGGEISPDNIKFVTSQYLSGLGEINKAIGSLDPQSIDYADQYDTLSKTAANFRAGLYSVLLDPQTSRHVNMQEILDQAKATEPPPREEPEEEALTPATVGQGRAPVPGAGFVRDFIQSAATRRF